MHFEGQVVIAAPRSTVWDFVIDPEKVASCGPGVESVEKLDATNFRAKAKVGIGLFRARFAVDAKMLEQVPPERVVIQARGQAPGSAVDATATMHLSDGPGDSTVMDWSADVVVGGAVAGIGARLIEGTANKMIGQTFDCMRRKLEA